MVNERQIVPMRQVGEVHVEGEMTPVAYMCYAQSPVDCAMWTADVVRSNVNDLLGTAKPGDRAIVIIDTSGANSKVMNPALLNELFPAQLHLGLWIYGTSEYQKALGEFKKTYKEKAGKVRCMHRNAFISDASPPDEGFLSELYKSLQGEGFHFSEKLVHWLAEEVKLNRELADSEVAQEGDRPQKRYKEAPPKGTHDPRGVLSW
ncbi:PREDICTED: uncharacterized protein LOC106815786 [Priapulus caudatus]|uniref:Uncharacterized protein LOC106815786 n=1 Tax=Priapulus caudatus TaxID=37621 RepID=A0ABM1EUA9_PRICU|nr:PREDICTED: uncharacterized protein LOC106815786 [Priapulus caudatus]